MKRFLMHLFLILCFLTAPFIHEAFAKIVIDIDSPSGEQLPIAVVPLISLDGSNQASFREFHNLLQRDLRMTGLFRILNQNAFLEPPGKSVDVQGTDFSAWRKIGADALIKAAYRREGQGYVLEARLFDVQQQEVLVGKRYSFDERSFARVVHTFVDQILLKLTGQKGVFSSTRLAAVSTIGGKKEIIELNVDGSETKQITRHRSVTLAPSWSDDGRFLTYTSLIRKNPDLYLYDRKRDKEMSLSNRQGLNMGASFAPNRGVLAVALSIDSDPEICLLNLKGELVKSLTQNFWIDIEPTWSPDGQMLAFVSNESGQPHIYRMNADGSGRRRLTYQGYHNVSPIWSPRGDKIAFAGRDEGFFDIFIMDPDGTHIQRLTMGQGNNESPSFAPNGQMLAFHTTRTGKEQLYIMGLDGRGQTQITDGIGRYTEPAWSTYLSP